MRDNIRDQIHHIKKLARAQRKMIELHQEMCYRLDALEWIERQVDRVHIFSFDF